MLLERLRILSNEGIIRDISFRLQGLNLVVDTTPPSDDSTISGNNVGKTTFIRSIDFCFGSNGKDIYVDKENKSDNLVVKEFLFKNEVSFHLSLLNKRGEKIILKRSFKSSDDLYINEIQFKTLTEYSQKLNELFFHINAEETKVSFRNIIKKFVRSDSFSESNILKILYPITKDPVYEAMYLFLFGFPNQDIVTKRLKLISEIDIQKKELRKIRGKSNLPRLTGRLTQLQSMIDEMEGQIKNLELPKTYSSLINRLKLIKSRTSTLSSALGNLNTKINLSQKTKNELTTSESSIDPHAINNLYKEAKLFLGTLEKSFEEVLAFHNKMVANKLKFVDRHILNLTRERDEVKRELDKLLVTQAHLLKLLDNTGTFDDLIKVREEVNELYTEKGKIVQQMDEIQRIQNAIDQHTIELSEVNIDFDSYVETLNKNIADTFNKYFTRYTNLTHGEQLYIYYDSENGKFMIDKYESNSGDGYKKTEIIAFDLAFINYFSDLGLDFPKFIIHDKLEIVHQNQIQSTFEIADALNGQFVVSVLRERISFLGDDYIDNHKILELSQNEKFFKF